MSRRTPAGDRRSGEDAPALGDTRDRPGFIGDRIGTVAAGSDRDRGGPWDRPLWTGRPGRRGGDGRRGPGRRGGWRHGERAAGAARPQTPWSLPRTGSAEGPWPRRPGAGTVY